MAIPTRKYFSEVTLGLNTKNAMIIPPEQLNSGKIIPKDAQEVIDTCHIYLICRRPRLNFVPEKFEYNNSGASGFFVRKINGDNEEHEFKFKLKNLAGGKVEVSPYPHRELLGFDKEGIVQYHWPASMISTRCLLKSENLNDFEVLYVGQAFGDGTRTAFDRLKSHDTLQKILAEMYYAHPDDEVMLFLFEYEPAKVFVSMDGIANDAQISGDQDMEHLRSVLDNPLNEKEEIGIAEAGLIWYFKPEYNKKLKNSYPTSDLKLLESCYNLDFVSLVIEINTDEFPVRLWSSVRSPGHHHIANYDLHDPKKRRTFFSLTDDEGEITLIDTSGPTY